MQTKFNIGDKVKILDGKEIDGYIGCWTPTMSLAVGEIVTIDCIRITDKGVSYFVKEIDLLFDERGLELADDIKPAKLNDDILFLAALFAGLL